MVTPKDWVLLALSAAEGHPVTPVQIQKCLFLLKKELPQTVGTDFYNFIPYNYGPFCRDVYMDAEQLENDELISIAPARGHSWSVYTSNPAGLDRAREIQREVPQEALEYLRQAMNWCRRLTFEELVRAIYKKYPEYRENSVFQG